MSVLNYYDRPFSSSQQNLQDTFERIGQTLARPLTIIAGHSYRLHQGKPKEFNPHLVEKIILVSLAILTLPLSLPLIGLGLLLISKSSSHKNLAVLVRPSLIKKSLPSFDVAASFERQTPLSLEEFRKIYRLFPDHLDECKIRYESKQSGIPLSDEDLTLYCNREHAWLKVCQAAYDRFADEKGTLPSEILHDLLALYKQQRLEAGMLPTAFQLASLIIDYLPFDPSFAQKNPKLIEAVILIPVPYLGIAYHLTSLEAPLCIVSDYYRLRLIKFFFKFNPEHAESLINYYLHGAHSSMLIECRRGLALICGSEPFVLSMFIKELMSSVNLNLRFALNRLSDTTLQSSENIQSILGLLENHPSIVEKPFPLLGSDMRNPHVRSSYQHIMGLPALSDDFLSVLDHNLSEWLLQFTHQIESRILTAAPRRRDESGRTVISQSAQNLAYDFFRIEKSLSWIRRREATIAIAMGLPEEESA